MEKIKKLIKLINNEKIDGYLIPKNDEYFGEYISDDHDRLKYITGFSGSYGFSLILKKKNYLFVDGRYSLQADKQSGKFFKIITIHDKTYDKILNSRKLLIGFDPKLFTKQTLKRFSKSRNFRLMPLKKNLIDKIWKRKIKFYNERFYNLPKESIDVSYKSKIKKVTSILKKSGTDFLLITASENNAWLLNIRGKDSKYSPIPNSYILIDRNGNIKFFTNPKKISYSLKKYFNKIDFININLIEKTLNQINNKKFIIDANTCSFHFENIILKNNKIVNGRDPIYEFKSIKSNKELENIKRAHIIDGVALTKYLFWIKKNFKKKKISEISASRKLYEFRKKNKKFKFLSFPTISGSGPNGAIIHYKANKQSNRILKKGDIYLVDSGGQYKFGTTDVTRTISLDNSNKRIKNIFTRVLKGHIAVSRYNLKENSSGSEIDGMARKFLKQIGLNYPHGTGHGVGYFLNVHEGPHAFSKYNKVKLKVGMVTSNEPGYYEKNKFGIRIENLIYIKIKKGKKCFEDLTMAPIDKNLIDQKILSKNEKIWLNNYHKKVFDNLKNFMNKAEYIELKKACLAI